MGQSCELSENMLQAAGRAFRDQKKYLREQTSGFIIRILR